MDTENLLIDKAKSGDEYSFSKLINTYENYVFAIILNFVKDQNDIENIAQEVFLQVYVSLPRFDNDNFKGWIGRIASSKSIDFLRKKKAKYREEVIEDEVLEKVDLNRDDSPEVYLVKKERHEQLLIMINSIPNIYRDVLIKFYFQEKSYEIIANEEGVSVKTIASRLYRAKLLLKENWRDKYEAL
ncbi:sigma-70 family RNA polymerase sigma factor [Tissierella sp. Yu-01]|uniref:RNA polymerase sigma factor n=1 Tax=Tissierella sp. Yu-01 TaxID=3035694 RepID=UPI00240E5CC8|nr:sigma-70 family RNA polymerase sigma factor [Tissierella sp. Yu-01]WFA08741.1 sigma-70 family RNA polymerase sigma factor [Tissierella sp. Yu-01]